ncbi:MAG: hypothetical protein ACMG6S_09510 [Byssovorax sp.]
MIGCGIGLTRGGGGAPSPAWSPALLGGKLLWLRGDLGVQLVGGKVVQWDDQSGLGNHGAALGSGTTQPIQTTWPAGLGAPAIYFDGNDRLATAANVLPTADGAGFTILFAGAFDDTLARCPVRTNGTSGGDAISQNVGGDSKLEHWKVGVVFSTDGPARTTPLSVVIVDQVGAAPESVMYVNGAEVPTSAPNGTVLTPSGPLYVGAAISGQFHKGFIAEILILSGRASLETIALWHAYTLSRYGV